MRRHPITIWIFGVFFFVLALGCDSKKEILISGETMGTTYHIKVVAGLPNASGKLKKAIDMRLAEINQSMSTYIKDSEIRRFNAIDTTDKTLTVSRDFYTVLVLAEKIYRLTEGAWDGTLEPVIDLWGFGPSGRRDEGSRLPTEQEIKKRLSTIGFDQVVISPDRTVRKKNADIAIDLNSIAKGFAVDQIAILLKEKGIDNFLVEIGGEMIASGVKADAKNWRVGINLPRTDAAYDNVYKILQLHGKAMATSGDYRNFFEVNGKRYSHVFDPRSGYPVENGVVSASVIADTCGFADGLATALMVLGAEKGIALVDSLASVECLVIVEGPNRELTDYYSKGFHTFESDLHR